MGEVFEPEGMRPANPGELAEIDQISAGFKDLTLLLMELHNRTEDLIVTAQREDAEPDPRAMRDISGKLFETLIGQFAGKPEESLSKVFSYIMFLIDRLVQVEDARIALAHVLERAASNIEGLAGNISSAADLLNAGTVATAEQSETYITGAGQKLGNVHSKDECVGWCVIHDPLPGPWRDWPTVWRGDGPFDLWRGFERRCPCGIGHTAVEETLRGNGHPHGCCGVCPCGPPVAVAIMRGGQLVGYQ